MRQRRNWIITGALAVTLLTLWACQDAIQRNAVAQGVEAPLFEVDPLWPQPLPDGWRLGSVIGVWVDDQDLIWIVHRASMTLANNERQMELDPPTSSECCIGAPPILAFDQAGNLVHSWGGLPGEDYQGYEWPGSNHGIFVDHLGYVWLGGNGPADSQIMKFTQTGDVVAVFGQTGERAIPGGDQPTFAPDSHDTESFGRVAKVFVDAQTNEVYAADGYLNRRVAVLNGDTGEMLRYWGAYGNEPDDNYVYPERGPNQPPPQQFRSPVHCADVSVDRRVYVCDRQANRLQVFTMDGEFLAEEFYAPVTLGSGTTWDIAFSRDPEQRYIFLADGVNERIRVVVRETLQEITNFGAGGRQPGQFYGVHSIATDSQGNIYITETYEGKRLQKFTHMGMGSVPRQQGVVWPN